MNRKQHKGLFFTVQTGRAASAGWLLPLLSGTALFAATRLTGVGNTLLPAVTGTAVCALALGKRKWLPSGILAAFVLSLLILRGRILDGFCQWYNGVGAVCTAGSGMVLPALECSGTTLNLTVFICWTSALAGVGIAFLGRLGRILVSAAVLILLSGASIVLGRMVDPLPLLAAAAVLCTGRDWKRNALPIGILAFFALVMFLPGFNGWAAEQSGLVLHKIHHYKYETGYTTLPEGRLEPVMESDAPALIVTMDKPEVLYLRGFTGAQIEDGRWIPLDNASLAENRDLLYWLNSREFDLRAQFEAAAAMMETGNNTVTVQNIGACSAYRYIPFTIRGDELLIAEDLRETAAGERYDSFTTVYGGAAMVPELLAALEESDSRYLQAEAAYREFVQAHYLAVPEEMTEKMQPYWDRAEGMDTQSAVKTVLEKCYPDGVRHDPFYATAAVLTLRHFGIPARYAEGYILPQTTATTLELTGRHAACWAEVYHEGIGWMPMALTPGLEGETEQQEEQLPPDAPEETCPPETEPLTQPEPEGGYQVRIARVLLYGGAFGLLLLVLLIAGLILRRRMILKRRRRILDQEDLREAITWCFADTISLLDRMGIRRGNGSLDVLLEPVRERFGAELAETFEAASRLNAKALFSSHPLTEEERQLALGFRVTAVALLRQSTGGLGRLWLQYILCLF